MHDEIKLIQNNNGEFVLYEPYATVDYMTEEDFIFVQKAVEKQTPRKPTPHVGKYATSYYCPACGEPHYTVVNDGSYFPNGKKVNYCDKCGQKIDWEGIDNAAD